MSTDSCLALVPRIRYLPRSTESKLVYARRSVLGIAEMVGTCQYDGLGREQEAELIDVGSYEAHGGALQAKCR